MPSNIACDNVRTLFFITIRAYIIFHTTGCPQLRLSLCSFYWIVSLQFWTPFPPSLNKICLCSYEATEFHYYCKKNSIQFFIYYQLLYMYKLWQPLFSTLLHLGKVIFLSHLIYKKNNNTIFISLAVKAMDFHINLQYNLDLTQNPIFSAVSHLLTTYLAKFNINKQCTT